MDRINHIGPPPTGDPQHFAHVTQARLVGRSGLDPAKWDDLRLALRQKGVNLDWLPAGHQQAAEIDFYTDREIDGDYLRAETLMTSARAEPEKVKGWREREDERRRSASLTLSC